MSFRKNILGQKILPRVENLDCLQAHMIKKILVYYKNIYINDKNIMIKNIIWLEDKIFWLLSEASIITFDRCELHLYNTKF